MDWTLAINLNRDALLRLVAALFDKVGLVPGGSVERLSRCIRRAVLPILRPAESAARRLVIVEARGMSMPKISVRSKPVRAIPRGVGDRVPAFRLFDPRKRFEEISMREPRFARGPGPRIFHFEGSGPLVVPSIDELAAERGDSIDAAQICRRLQALKAALDDLPKQARRLMRMQARRALAPPGPGRYLPLRPGWPPGHQTRHIRPVNEILSECDRLARRALEPPDRA